MFKFVWFDEFLGGEEYQEYLEMLVGKKVVVNYEEVCLYDGNMFQYMICWVICFFNVLE